jgi:hypothetical protein
MTGCACLTGRRQRRGPYTGVPGLAPGPGRVVALRRDGKPPPDPDAPHVVSTIAAGEGAVVSC